MHVSLVINFHIKISQHLRGVELNEAIAFGLFGVLINGHVEAILDDLADLTVDSPNDGLELLDLLRRNHR